MVANHAIRKRGQYLLRFQKQRQASGIIRHQKFNVFVLPLKMKRDDFSGDLTLLIFCLSRKSNRQLQVLPQGGFNFGRSNNAEAIKLIEAGRSELDRKKRQQIYWQLEEVIYNDYQDAFLWYEMGVLAFRKNVMGWDDERWFKYKEAQYFSHPYWFEDGKQ